MKLKFATTIASLVFALVQIPAQAQTKDTLQKIKESGVINLGGRDASFPFSYKISADSNPIGYSADICTKVVDLRLIKQHY